MAVVKYFLRNTQTNLGTGGSGYDLLTVQGTPTTLGTGNLNSTDYTEMLFWQVTVNATPITTTFPTSINVNSISGTLGYRWRIQRVDSSNNVLASSAYSNIFSTTGINTATLTLSQTWQTGDRFRLSFEIARTGGHGNVSLNLNINDANSFVDIDKGEEVVVQRGNFFLMF